MTLTLNPRPLKSNKFICGLNYTISQFDEILSVDIMLTNCFGMHACSHWRMHALTGAELKNNASTIVTMNCLL